MQTASIMTVAAGAAVAVSPPLLLLLLFRCFVHNNCDPDQSQLFAVSLLLVSFAVQEPVPSLPWFIVFVCVV